MNRTRKYDLEERLIKFALQMMNLSESLPNSRSGNHIAGQLVRCGTSPAFNYGEAQSAESRKDFIHKMKIILKELRETRVCLKIVHRKPFVKPSSSVENDLKECGQLIAIFAASINTASRQNN